jgi:YHS domain-containing protein
MKTLLFASMLGLLVALSAQAWAEDPKAPTTAPTTQPAPVNKSCPVTGESVDPKVVIMHEGKCIGFCCKQCVAPFKKDPAKYMGNLK